MASYIFSLGSRLGFVVHRQIVALEIPIFAANWAGVYIFVLLIDKGNEKYISKTNLFFHQFLAYVK